MQRNKEKSDHNLLEGDIEIARKYYAETGNMTGIAYCKFLSGDTEGAKILLNEIKESDPAVKWLLYLIDLIEDREGYTTYFKVRNFYEQDLELLYIHNQKEIAEKIISKIKETEKYNKEVYKYAARLLINNNEYEKAEIMLKKSSEIYYNDPETRFMIGEIYMKRGEYKKAIKEYERADEAAGGYLPAKKKLKEIINGL